MSGRVLRLSRLKMLSNYFLDDLFVEKRKQKENTHEPTDKEEQYRALLLWQDLCVWNLFSSILQITKREKMIIIRS